MTDLFAFLFLARILFRSPSFGKIIRGNSDRCHLCSTRVPSPLVLQSGYIKKKFPFGPLDVAVLWALKNLLADAVHHIPCFNQAKRFSSCFVHAALHPHIHTGENIHIGIPASISRNSFAELSFVPAQDDRSHLRFHWKILSSSRSSSKTSFLLR